ncbi:hypothetical protein F53441_11698 [Fusarium austroafricanum]|uniref:Helicase ATP-binding domain-containing protein n=1 Tax=Fusarium austroafricanum TaxID=2364996 RepID=A0A8H4K0X7_9HYPO|nr:hypothetical protein F53441_11698 [Fusarium austroafricanum]
MPATATNKRKASSKARRVKRRKTRTLTAIRPDELAELKDWLREHAPVKDDTYHEVDATFLESIASQGTNASLLERVAQDESFANEDEAGNDVEGEGEGNDTLGNPTQQRELLNSLVSNARNLEEIYRDIGVSTDRDDWKEGLHVPGMLEEGPKARPHQIIGTDWIRKTLSSPIRAAILADDCGTGKTLQIGLALAMHYNRAKKVFDEGNYQPLDEQRHFKPSVIFCSAEIAYQTFREPKQWFVNDPVIKPFVLHPDGLQNWINQKAKAHENPETLKHILIAPHYTAIRRMMHPANPKKKRTSEIETKKGSGKRKSNQKAIDDERTGRSVTGEPANILEDDAPLKITGERFNWVICDDLYALRSPRRQTYKLVKKLDKEAILVCSSTPLLNQQNDFWGYINLFWRHGAWPFRFRMTDRIDARVYYDKEAWPAMKEGKEFNGLTMGHVLHSRETRPNGPLTEREQLQRDEFCQFIEEGKGPLFLLNPDLFQAFRNLVDDDRSKTAQAIRPLLQLFCLRRGMLTELRLPDGTSVTPGDGISSMRLRTVVLKHHDLKHELEMLKIGTEYYPYLMSSSGDPHDEHIGHGTIDEGMGAMINSAILRTLNLSSTNLGFYNPLKKRDGTTNFLDSGEAKLMLRGRTKARTTRLQAAMSGRRLPTGSIAPADSEQLNEIVKMERYKGLGWYHHHTRENEDEEFPEVRDIPKTFCKQSPKVCWTIERVLELHSQGKRVLVFVNSPLTSILSLKTLNIRSSDNPTERSKAVREFNNPGSLVDVLVTSFQLCGFGLNLHRVCHYGIIVEYPLNLPTMIHALGRLWRLGQKNEVNWDILYLENSFDAWMDTQLSSKYAEILAAEGQISSAIKGQYAIICGFELIKMYLGQDSNRYPRTRVTWCEQNHASVALEGHFYSAVARYLMQNPTHCDKFPRGNLSEVAIRWQPGLELTLDMIEGRAPALEGGVVLDSRNRENPGYQAVEPAVDALDEISLQVELLRKKNVLIDEYRLDNERARRI